MDQYDYVLVFFNAVVDSTSITKAIPEFMNPVPRDNGFNKMLIFCYNTQGKKYVIIRHGLSHNKSPGFRKISRI